MPVFKWSAIFQVKNQKTRVLVIGDMSHHSGGTVEGLGKESGTGRGQAIYLSGPHGFVNPTKPFLSYLGGPVSSAGLL